MNLLIPVFSPATGTWGGLTRAIAVAEAAQAAGHRVAFCASGELYRTLQPRGYRVYRTPAPTVFGLPRPVSQLLEKRSQQVALPAPPGRDFGNIWLVLVLSGMAQGSYLRELVRAERAAAQDFEAQAIFTDLDPGAFLLARIEGLPISAAYQTPMREGAGSPPWKLLNRAVQRVQKTYGLPEQAAGELFHGPQVLKIIPSIPELEDTDPGRPDVRYVGRLLGPIRAGSDFRPEPGRRYVFAYLGTGAVPLRRLRERLPQVFPADGNTTCLVGAQSIEAVERAGGVEFRPYVPAGEVLPYCDWTICHGGQNTILESLLHGVPLLIFPGPIFERRYNARKVQAAGAGVMGEVNEFTPEWIRRALERQAEYAAGAERLGEKARACGGAPEAVRAIEAWAGTGGAT